MEPTSGNKQKEELGGGSNSPNSPDSKNKLSEREKSNRIYSLNRGIEEALKQSVGLFNQLNFTLKTMSERIREIAEMVRELNDLSDNPEPPSTICGKVIELFHKKEIGILDKDQLIRYALPREYKRDYERNAEKETEDEEEKQVQGIKSVLEATVESFIKESSAAVSEVQNSTLLDMTDPEKFFKLSDKQKAKVRDAIRDQAEKLGRLQKESRKQQRVLSDYAEMFRDKCDQMGIAVDPESVEEKKDVVSAEPIMSGYSEFAEVVEEFIALWERILDKIIRFKPLNEEMIKNLTQVMRLQLELDKPLADEKFRAESVQWLINGANEAYRGKHAAAEMYHYILPKKTMAELKELPEDVLARVAIDPEYFIGQVICHNKEQHEEGHVLIGPKGMTECEECGNKKLEVITMEKVTIVREQMGDVKEALERLSANVLAVIPKYTATVSWFAQHPGWSIAKRKQEAHEVLSKAA